MQFLFLLQMSICSKGHCLLSISIRSLQKYMPTVLYMLDTGQICTSPIQQALYLVLVALGEEDVPLAAACPSCPRKASHSDLYAATKDMSSLANLVDFCMLGRQATTQSACAYCCTVSCHPQIHMHHKASSLSAAVQYLAMHRHTRITRQAPVGSYQHIHTQR